MMDGDEILSHRHHLALDEATALLAAIVASSDDAILSKTLDGTITSWNAATSRLFLYASEEMIGRSIRLLIPPDRQDEEDHILSQIMAGNRIENYETVRLRKDGSPVEVAVTISPVRDGEGNIIGASKIIRDISEHKRAERRIAVLLKEVNHRSKNLLSLVQAIAHQTQARDMQEFREQFTARLQSLSASQDLLIEGYWTGVDLRDLAVRVLAPWADPEGNAISIEGKSIMLKPPVAQSLGMALHELATNAAKYGALSNGDGKVNLSWRVADRKFHMSWKEHGGPKVAPPEHQGYGSKVIAGLVESSVQGEVSLDFRPEGLCWHLKAPLHHVMTAG